MGRKSEEKKSFKLYNDYKKHFEQMTDEDAGKVIKAILAYVNYEEFPELEGAAAMAFSFIEAQLERDRKAYDRKCETNKVNGSKGGRPPKKTEEDPAGIEEPKETQENPEKPNGFVGFLEKPTETEPKQKKPERIAYPDEFNVFWNVYPRSVGKKEAYAQYVKRLKNGYTPEQLIKAAREYRKEMERKKQPEEYILHPKTFLGVGGRFEEYIPKDGEAQRGQDDGYGEVDFRNYM